MGIGTDVVEVNRIIEACKKEAFVNKCFTDNEKAIIEKRNRSAACNFAVKEAVVKMLGIGFSEFGPIDIEVLRDELGKPYINLLNKAKYVAARMKIDIIHVTISDTDDIAVAFVVGESFT